MTPRLPHSLLRLTPMTPQEEARVKAQTDLERRLKGELIRWLSVHNRPAMLEGMGIDDFELQDDMVYVVQDVLRKIEGLVEFELKLRNASRAYLGLEREGEQA